MHKTKSSFAHSGSRSGLLAVLVAAATAACSAPEDSEGVAQVRQRIATSSSAMVSVLLREDAPLAMAQDDIAATLSGTAANVLHNFVATPGMSIRLESAAALDLLAAHPSVERIDLSPSGGGGLNDSRGIVGANQAFAAGFDGAGRSVAVLDTGIQGNHPDLADDLVAEACVCNTGPSCCPNGSNFQEGAGAAADDNGHGTHVSGIISSRGTIAPRGIAPNADLVVVRMMNQNSFDSAEDITASLEWVLENRPDVDAINMSLQTGAVFPANCDVATPTHTPPAFITNMANVVQALKDVGVTTVSISGNYFNKGATSLPGCLSNVINVGNSTKDNQVNSSSNSDVGLDILAPGTDITSTLPGDGFGALTGTSMAAPHVAAAVAILRQADPSLGPDAIRGCVLTSATSLTDVNGITRPLLDIPAALIECGADPGPTGTLAVTLPIVTTWQNGYCMGVQLTNTGTTPTASWQVVLDLQGTQVTQRWNANFSSTSGVTTLTPVGWNAVIQPGQTIQAPTIGFCASRPLGSSVVATFVSATSN